jgi:hypothetical protein
MPRLFRFTARVGGSGIHFGREHHQGLWAFRELTIAIMLTSTDSITLPALASSMLRAGDFGQASA